VLLRSHGTPGFADLLIFVAGAIAGFNLVAVPGLAVTGNVQPIDSRRDRVLAGLLGWIALGAVVGALSAISAIHGWVPWLLGRSQRRSSTSWSRVCSWRHSLPGGTRIAGARAPSANHEFAPSGAAPDRGIHLDARRGLCQTLSQHFDRASEPPVCRRDFFWPSTRGSSSR
jgi:hypothetical protein